MDKIRCVEVSCGAIESSPHIAKYQCRRVTAHLSEYMGRSISLSWPRSMRVVAGGKSDLWEVEQRRSSCRGVYWLGDRKRLGKGHVTGIHSGQRSQTGQDFAMITLQSSGSNCSMDTSSKKKR